MTTSNMIALCLIFPLLVEMAGTETFIHQERGFISADVGDTVTLRCFHKGENTIIFSWYKQAWGTKLQLISTLYKYDNTTQFFYHEFKDNIRFSVEGGDGKNHLRIQNIALSDSATYYCGSGNSNKVEFGQGTILLVKGSGSGNVSVIRQPVSESVHPRDTETLNCTINTETCEGEQSVYWFRHDSGESPPGIIYTNGDRSGQCMKSPASGSPTQSCVYNLPKRNLSISDYCAVASCGAILFGTGPNQDIKRHYTEPVLLVYCLGVALGVSIILIIVLAYIIYKMNMMTCRQCKGLDSQITGPAVSCTDAGGHDADNLQYVALNLKNRSMSRRQRSNTEEETVVLYSSIRQYDKMTPPNDVTEITNFS
uniref:Ig-like domain-containing protein n=1 Tax=Esox lucius TaxID=8010 RepID=A0A3P8Z4L6_ESOLU